MNFKEDIKEYIPANEQEERDKENMLKFIETFDDVLTRNNEYGHFTATAIAVNEEKTKVLMVHHNIFNSWALPGGHADGENDLLGTAMRELQEETGVKDIKKISENIFTLETIAIKGHEKNGKYVSSHMHLNLTYLFEVSEKEKLKIQADENTAVEWKDIEKLDKISTDSWISERMYKKIKNKLENM